MPLAFDSTSHGTIAFGFFNIESHMLLLEDLFFFADDFCGAVFQLTAGAADAALPGWRITDPAARGNLHGAIAGQDLSGFIGATYRVCPFPAEPEEFKQNPEGALAREAVARLIAPFGDPLELPLIRQQERHSLGPFEFDAPGFSALVAYVDRGGYPRWRDERRPPYVAHMVKAWAGTVR